VIFNWNRPGLSAATQAVLALDERMTALGLAWGKDLQPRVIYRPGSADR
jgi:hypothetical protein